MAVAFADEEEEGEEVQYRNYDGMAIIIEAHITV